MNSYEYLTQDVAVSGVPKPAPPAILNGLPVEIWLIIFRHLIFSFRARTRLSVLFNIISVCHHWSDMAVNAASLWTSIVIEVSAPAPALAFNRSLLARTKDCAIDVTIVLPDSASAPFTSAHQNALVELLSPHLHHMPFCPCWSRSWSTRWGTRHLLILPMTMMPGSRCSRLRLVISQQQTLMRLRLGLVPSAGSSPHVKRRCMGDSLILQ
ncbi:hypothetical protein BDZ89DRAFT_418970 [Hymenopellis radicata]|nr:hypothetical protein BDZ89DRAFT_418970 [Hymenopellis radicata]